MASESKSFCQTSVTNGHTAVRLADGDLAALTGAGLAFSLILLAVWTPLGQFNRMVSWAALVMILGLSVTSRYSLRELGLASPLHGAKRMMSAGALLVAAVVAIGLFTRTLGSPQPLPWHRSWQYAMWALAQEFILQSFIYLRLESVFGGRRAVVGSAALFALAHIPNSLLTVLSFLGGLFFCEMFRCYRNLYPLGLVHAALGLTIAASLPDNLLHHMRVGIGFLTYRP